MNVLDTETELLWAEWNISEAKNVSLQQCGSCAQEQAAALGKVIHSVASLFQMNHPEGRRSSRAHLPHFLVCTKDIKDQALRLCVYDSHVGVWNINSFLSEGCWTNCLVHLLLWARHAWSGQLGTLTCNSTNLVPPLKRVHIVTPSSYFVSSASGKLFFSADKW